MSKKTIGITIGPIFDTLSNATKPAGLWFSSYFFSTLTKLLCKKIICVFQDANIISPYYKNQHKNNLEMNELIIEVLKEDTSGIGKYHDRIFFTTEQFNEDELRKLIDDVKESTYEFFVSNETSKEFKNEKNKYVKFLKQYLQIRYIVDDTENESTSKDVKSCIDSDSSNCILKLSKYLDALELMRTFPIDSEYNPFDQLFLNEKMKEDEPSIKNKVSNANIKTTALYTNLDDYQNQFVKGKNSIWSVEDIAACETNANTNEEEKDLKRFSYYAIVQADADNMTTFLSNMTNDKEGNIESVTPNKINKKIAEFSKRCLSCDEEAGKRIGTFGGMTIYAGGDDLLFFAPVINSGKSVFQLCDELQSIFRNKMLGCSDDSSDGDGYFNEKTIPTISFGISIHHVKQPLSDALSSARNLLFNIAKEIKGKNQMAVKLQKHSGTIYSFTIPNKNNCFNNETHINVIKKLMSACGYKFTNITEKNFSSAIIQPLVRSQKMLLQLSEKYIEKDTNLTVVNFKNTWQNFFDNPNQKEMKENINQLAEVFYNWKIKSIIDENKSTENKTEVLEKQDLEEFINVIQFIKFLNEKKGEGEE